jgi:glutathione peroxidase
MTQTVYDIAVQSIDGEPLTLNQFKGKVLLVVNVASKCGLTPQYEGLEKLYEDHAGKDFEILGFPANNFKAQEPGTDAEIKAFCSLTYDVKFPLFSKLSVVGADQHPLYHALTLSQPHPTGEGPFRERLKGYGMTPNELPEVLWLFTGRHGGRSPSGGGHRCRVGEGGLSITRLASLTLDI